MTNAEIQRHVDIIHEATAEAIKSKETARQFLIDAGITKDTSKKDGSKRAKKK